jgi:hypothetical protein
VSRRVRATLLAAAVAVLAATAVIASALTLSGEPDGVAGGAAPAASPQGATLVRVGGKANACGCSQRIEP